jgi:two-component system response regulator RegA
MNDLIKTADVSSELAGFEDRSLLLADDDRPFLTRLTRAMESRGFQVTAVDSVAEGLATIRRTGFT